MSGDEEIMEVDSSPGDENIAEEKQEKKKPKEAPAKPEATSSATKKTNAPW